MSPKTPYLLGLLACCWLGGGRAELRGQDAFQRLAGEYLLSGNLSGDQMAAEVAIGTAGGYVVWQDNVTDEEATGISAQRLNSNLSGTQAPFRVNSLGAGFQEAPRAALLPDGGAVFVWQGGALGFQNIFARFLAPEGTFRGPDIQVNTYTNDFQIRPAVAVLADGSVVVVWGSFNHDGHLQGVVARRLAGDGTLLGGEIRVNQATLMNQRDPGVAALADGGFVVVWISESDLGTDANGGTRNDFNVVARRFDPAGAARGAEFRVNDRDGVCASPTVAAGSDGGYSITWSQRVSTSARDGWDVQVRSFTAADAGRHDQVGANTTTFGDQYGPRITARGASRLVVWSSMGQDGSYAGIYGRVIGVSGVAAGGEFLVNSTTAGQQVAPAIAAGTDDNVVVVWSGYVVGGPAFDLFAQRYAPTNQLPVLPAPIASAVSQSRVLLSWAELAGYPVAAYRVYVDGSATPVQTTNNYLTAGGFAAASAHQFRMDYVLVDGRQSELSPAAAIVTWGDDANFDGLPDDWQARYWAGGTASFPDRLADSDGDGATNLQEFLAGTDPTSAASVLTMGVRHVGQGMLLDWGTEPGLIYQLQISTNAVDWANHGRTRFAAGRVDSVVLPDLPHALFRLIRIR